MSNSQNTHYLDHHLHLNHNIQNIPSNSLSPSQTLIKNKLSLQTCISSVSIQQQPTFRTKYKNERKLFMKFLSYYSANKTQEILQCFKEMKQQFLALDITEIKGNVFQMQAPQLLRKQGQADVDKIFSHYCHIWLVGMGYLSEKNKKNIINLVVIQLQPSKLCKAVQIYECMGTNIFSEDQRTSIILSTCLNGWQYFVNKICGIIKNEQKVIEKVIFQTENSE